jgi:hypothetical protein
MSSKTLGKVVFFSAVFLLILAGTAWAQQSNWVGNWKGEDNPQNTLTISHLSGNHFGLTAGVLGTPGWKGWGQEFISGDKKYLLATFLYNSGTDAGFVTFMVIDVHKIKYTSYTHQGVKRLEGYYIK